MARPLEKLSTAHLKKVLSDLKEASDIEEAVLIGEKNRIIACAPTQKKNHEAEILKILAQLRDWSTFTPGKHNGGMFAHHVLDYNGSKIVAAKCGNDLILFVMLQKHGYISIAMLELENSVREIKRILGRKNITQREQKAHERYIKPLLSNRNSDNIIFVK